MATRYEAESDTPKLKTRAINITNKVVNITATTMAAKSRANIQQQIKKAHDDEVIASEDEDETLDLHHDLNVYYTPIS